MTHGECEVDSYAGRLSQRDDGAIRSLETQLGCGVGWRTQLALGFSDLHSDGDTTRSVTFSGKTTLTEPREDDAGMSLAYGAPAEHEAGSATRLGDVYATLVGSFHLLPSLMLHANLGWTGSHKDSSNTTRWALALDHSYSESLHVVAETFADDHDHHPWLQVGAAQALSECVSINASYGRQTGGGNPQAITLGFIAGF